MWTLWSFLGHFRSLFSYCVSECQGYVLAFHVCKIILIADTFTPVTRGNVVKTPPINSYNGFCDFVLCGSGVWASLQASPFWKAGLWGCSSGSCCADWPRQSLCASSHQEPSRQWYNAFHASLVHDLYWISAGPAEKETMVMMSVGRGYQCRLYKGPEVSVKGLTAVNVNTQTQWSCLHPPAPLPYLSRLTALCLPAPLCWRCPFFSQRHRVTRPEK